MLLAALAAVVAPLGAWAQEVDAVGGEGWNSPRVIELVERARERRALPDPDSGLFSFRAEAGGYLYYYLDRADSDGRTLVKVDQIALEVLGPPNRTSSHHRAPPRRSCEQDLLPPRCLTVVQNEFDDRIRGDGDGVALYSPAPRCGVGHDYRLADSLAIHSARTSRSGSTGRGRPGDRIFLLVDRSFDRATAAIMRMTFTFTPASCVDPRGSTSHVSLENGLWEGGTGWRRAAPRDPASAPRSDLPADVIRGVMRIRNYRWRADPAVVFRALIGARSRSGKITPSRRGSTRVSRQKASPPADPRRSPQSPSSRAGIVKRLRIVRRVPQCVVRL